MLIDLLSFNRKKPHNFNIEKLKNGGLFEENLMTKNLLIAKG